MLSILFPTRLVSSTLLESVATGSGLVGVREIRNSRGATIRIFYPAASKSPGVSHPVPVFRNGLSRIVEGYSHTFLGSFVSPVVLGFLNYFLRLFLWLHPLSWSAIPRCYIDLPQASYDAKIPLIVWSHGLTGTSCEHGFLAASLALRGIAVALVHHSDGSSSMVDLKPPEGNAELSWLKYQHPSYTPSYDVGFRQRQAEHRAEEVEEMRKLVLERKDLAIDPNKVVVAGFSFGAATAGIVAAQNPKPYAAAMFIDGWWHIELKKHKVAQDLPLQAHSNGISLPSLFIGSAEFQGYRGLNDATERIQAKVAVKEVHVMENTRHGNFMDAVWWMPVVLTTTLGFSGATDPHVAYAKFANLVADFVERSTGSGGKIKN